MSLRTILRYWFGDIRETAEYYHERNQLWFRGGPEVDSYVREHFLSKWEDAVHGQLQSWEGSPRGRLALLILLDQFSRHLFRGSPRAFAQDALARRICLEGMQRGDDAVLHCMERLIYYLPLEHAEDPQLQRKSISCYSRLAETAPAPLKEGMNDALNYALRHHEIIATFGRFPHRNALLKRVSTPEEEAFLKLPDSSF